MKAEIISTGTEILLGQSAPLFKGGEINHRITANIFGVDDESLEKVVGKLLLEHKKTIALAESCTGGLISSKLTDIPGSSAYYLQGLITYSNEAKRKLLGVHAETLETFGAVSSQTAREMAMGILNISSTDFGLAVTGIAGPGGGTAEKPVGLVYIALAEKGKCDVKEYYFTGDRASVKLLTANAALNMVRKRLLLI